MKQRGKAAVTPPVGLSASVDAWANRWHVWRAGQGATATGFVSQPEPRTIGLFARGRQLIAGNYLFAGTLIEAPGVSIWDVDMPDAAYAAEVQGFAWLDDLAAVGDARARACAQDWVFGWIDRYGGGQGPGWTPDLSGRRVIRWINHALLLLNGRPSADTQAFFRSLGHQTIYLSRRWRAAAPGLPRFEALTGLIYAGLALEGMAPLVPRASEALARDCASQIDAAGGLPTRNPEELLEVFTLLTWAAQALAEAGQVAPREHLDAIDRIAPTLRALRHADGSLARFHGGGRGLEGRLDHALANAGVKTAAQGGLSMGFVRLSAGRTTVIVDAAAPPDGRASRSAHASTLAFEVTSGRRPVIVNCGSGAPFGPEWRRAGRATASHSTLTIDGFSSSRLGPAEGGEALVERAEVIALKQLVLPDGDMFRAAHTGWSQTHGLSHMRELLLSPDGRSLRGEDTLGALTPEERERFEAVLTRTRLAGVKFALRFHLHPDVDAQIDLGGSAVSLALKSGEIWVFRHDGVGRLRLDPSVYLERGRLKPRATKQIVVTAKVIDYAAQIGWTLAKAQDTPLAIRDLDRDDLPA